LRGNGFCRSDYINFDGIDQNVFADGDSFTSGHGVMTALGGGFVGAVADFSSCFLAVCPVGNDSQFYAGLNDGALSISLMDELLHLTSLDFGFVLPLAQLVDFSVGQLLLTGEDESGAKTSVAKDFGPQDANGNYGFEHWVLDASFTSMAFKSVTVSACLFNVDGACVNPAENQAQFAIDNIGYIPEPASMALLGVSFASLLAAGSRRKAR
jgi:hypothetical protein